MSFNGSGTFQINTAGQPVVANTVISATVFNALTADLANGLSTCITKDGQTTITANIPFGGNKITGLGAGTAASDAAQLGQVQSTAAKLITVTGTDTITGSMSPQLTAYAAGQLLYFIANAANTGAMTINIDGLGAKNITRDGSTALIAGDVVSGEIVVICYDGTRFQMINAANSFGNTTINGTLTVTGNTALQANVSITSALSVGGVFAVTGAATLGSTLEVTGKSDLPTVSTASMNAAVAVITTGTVTNLTSTSASIASANAAVALITTGTVTNLTATGASIASANLGNAVITSMTLTGASVASANVGTATITGNLTLNGGTANGVLYLNGSKVATSGSALTFDGTNFVGPNFRSNSFMEIRSDTANLYWENAANTRYYSMALSGTSTSPTLLTTYFDGTSVLNRLALDSSGNLGIGISPDERLTVTATNPTDGRVASLRNNATSSLTGTNLGFNQATVDNWNIGQPAGVNAFVFCNSTGSANERMRIDASGNLGLGVTPSAWGGGILGFQNRNTYFASDTGPRLFVGANAYYDGAWKYLANGYATRHRSSGAEGDFQWAVAPSGTAGNTITFTTAMELNASGGLKCLNTIGVGNATPSTSGAGVTFPATQSASSDANTLDDYEEGTWTGTLKGGTTDPTTPVTATGKYTKIGRQVTVAIYFENVNTTGAAGYVFVSGLPFTEDGTRAVGTAATYNFDLNTGTSVFADIASTSVYLVASKDDAAWIDVLHNAGAGRYLRITVTYFV